MLSLRCTLLSRLFFNFFKKLGLLTLLSFFLSLSLFLFFLPLQYASFLPSVSSAIVSERTLSKAHNLCYPSPIELIHITETELRVAGLASSMYRGLDGDALNSTRADSSVVGTETDEEKSKREKGYRDLISETEEADLMHLAQTYQFNVLDTDSFTQRLEEELLQMEKVRNINCPPCYSLSFGNFSAPTLRHFLIVFKFLQILFFFFFFFFTLFSFHQFPSC